MNFYKETPTALFTFSFFNSLLLPSFIHLHHFAGGLTQHFKFFLVKLTKWKNNDVDIKGWICSNLWIYRKELGNESEEESARIYRCIYSIKTRFNKFNPAEQLVPFIIENKFFSLAGSHIVIYWQTVNAS